MHPQSSGTFPRSCGTLKTTAARGEDRPVRFQGPAHRRRIHVPGGEALVGQIAQGLQFREQIRGVPSGNPFENEGELRDVQAADEPDLRVEAPTTSEEGIRVVIYLDSSLTVVAHT